jgi:hypothetical protein
MNRGDRREAVFRDDQDRKRFISTLGEACQKTGWAMHAYWRELLEGWAGIMAAWNGQRRPNSARPGSWRRS